MTNIRELYVKKLIDELKKKQDDHNKLIGLDDVGGDVEAEHMIADQFMCDLLRKLGYSELVDFIESQERWYA